MQLRRPSDDATATERAFERHLDADALRPVEVPPLIDVDAVIAGIGDNATRGAATAAHRPFEVEERASVHAFFEAYLARLLEIHPDSSFRLGVHPHPRSIGDYGDAADIRWLLLARDAARILREWPGADRLPVHDRIDRAALLGHVEMSLRWQHTPDLAHLDEIDRWFDAFVVLADVPCCPAADRIAAATARLRELPGHLRRVIDLLDVPPKARVLATAETLDAADEYLESYSRHWRAAPEDAVAQLSSALAPAREALTEAAGRLRNAIAPKANGSIAIGAANTALTLRVGLHLPLDARTLYEQALDELRDAHDDMRAAFHRTQNTLTADVRDPSEMQIRELRAACSAWITPLPADEGVVTAPLPALWQVQGASAVYLDPGPLAKASAGVVYLGESSVPEGPSGRDYADFVRRHTLAHETYPGHRLQAVASRAACRLRRFIDDRVLAEGWAVYAEDLLHESNGCVDGGLDDWTRAEERAGYASGLMTELLLATGTLSEAELAAHLLETGWTEATPEQVGAIAARALYSLGYSVGRNEIFRLRHIEEGRLGTAFDLRAFHAKLLAAGPISPRLIEAEWAAQGR